MEAAVGHPKAVFQSLRRLELGPQLMEWCSFQAIAPLRWHGCVGCLDSTVSSLKFITELVVLYQFSEGWAHTTKLTAFISTAHYTGELYKCAQVFDKTSPPYGFDESGYCLPGVISEFEPQLTKARAMLDRRHIEERAKKRAAQARATARAAQALSSPPAQ
jgi:hypothetical protein